MKAPPIVDDASQVVEIIRQKSPSAELNLALQNQKPVTHSMLPSLEEQEQLQLQHQEEKKEDVFALAEEQHDVDALSSLLKTASYVEEEGQEACWIDRSVSGGLEPTKPRSLFTSKKSTPTTPKKINGMNILLLNTPPPPPPPPPPRPNDDYDSDKQREAAHKAEMARKLLDQALSVNHIHVSNASGEQEDSRELLAQSAFREATDARKLLDTPSQELDTVLLNAKTKGEAAAALARQMLLQEERTVAATITAEEDEEASLSKGPPLKLLEEQVLDGSKGSGADHASRARQYLEFILPDVGLRGIPRATIQSQQAAVEKMDDMSTLGFDNTYVDSSPTNAGGDPLDILSIGSLNEILDGPMDKSPEKVLAEKDEPKKKRGGFFGSVFRSKKNNAKEEITSKSQVIAPNEVMKVTGSKAAGKKKPSPKIAEKTAKGAEKEIKRFVATVMVEDGVEKPLEREISNIEELKKYQAVDEQMERQLLEAMSNDETESVTSLQGVRMHGKQAKPKPDKKKKSDKDAVEEPEPPPPRDSEKYKLTFVSVPKGDPGILMQKSWESLVENEAVPAEERESPKREVTPRTSERSPKVYPPPPMDDAQAALAPVPSRSPASSINGMDEEDKYTTDMEKEDKYTVPLDVEEAKPDPDDRYAVAGNDCESFEFCWNSCGQGDLKMVRGDSAAVPAPQLEPVETVQRNVTEDTDDSGIPAPSESALMKQSTLMKPAAVDKNAGKKSPVRQRGLGKLFGRKPKVQGNTGASKGSTSKSKGATAPASEDTSRRANALHSTVKSRGATAPPSAAKSKVATAPPSGGKSNGSSRSMSKSSAPAPVPAEKTASKSPVKPKVVTAPPSIGKSNGSSRSMSKSSAPAPIPAEKTASKSPVKPKASSRSVKSAPTVKVAPLTSALNNKPKDRNSGIFGKRNTKETPLEIQRDTSTIRPVNISVVTTDSPTEYKSNAAASFEPDRLNTGSADENKQDALPLLDQIKEQRNRPRKGLDPLTNDEPPNEQRGIDP
jgi:hypothetical protein